MIKEEIEKWFQKEDRVTDYRNGMMLLERSGVFPLIFHLGVPVLVGKEGGSMLEAQALQGAWSNGHHTCLEELRNFERLFQARLAKPVGDPDFCGDAMALARGYLTPEDIEKDNKR